MFVYNTVMLKFFVVVLFSFSAAGCAVNTIYDPLQYSGTQTLLLNEAAFRQVTLGMTPDEVHRIMGDKLIIGYSYQDLGSPGEKPITMANPYKTAVVKTSKGECTAEYYVNAVHHPDGVVSDDELLPLVFCGGHLRFEGWGQLK